MVTLAAEKYGMGDWTVVNPISSEQWLRDLRQTNDSLRKGCAHARNVDTVFGDVIRGRCKFHIHAKSTGKFEYFNTETHSWEPDATSEMLSDWIRDELCECYGVLLHDPFTNEVQWGKPPEPVEQEEFINKIAKCLVKYMKKTPMAKLDSTAADKLLFSDGMMVNFVTKEVRRAQPEDRLYKHCMRPYEKWTPSEATEKNTRELVQSARDFWLQGGTDLAPRPAGDLVIALEHGGESEQLKTLREKVCDLIKKLCDAPECRMFRGLYNLTEARSGNRGTPPSEPAPNPKLTGPKRLPVHAAG